MRIRNIVLSALVLVGLASPAGAVTYYISSTAGSDSYAGTDASHPFLTISKAASLVNPGDSVEIMAGTYAPFWITRSGSSGNVITFESYQGQSVTVQKTSAAWDAIEIRPNVSYITIHGLNMVGNAQSITYAQAIAAADYNNTTNGSCLGMGNTVHHIIISNNTASWCPGGGINIDGDYITMYGNVIHNNSYWSPLANSGTTVIGKPIDASTDAKIFVYDNIYYGNQNFVCNKFQTSNPCRITDGEGIIVDSNKANGWTGRIQIYNNIVYNNGSAGIEVYQSQHTDVFNNTLYVNNKSADETDPNYIAHTSGGELIVNQSADVKVENNILYGNSSVPMLYGSATGNTSLVWDYNLYFAGTGASADTPNAVLGDPRFINPVIFDFRLQSCLSPAQNKGTAGLTSLVDYAGTARGSVPSIGAYQ